VPGVGLAGFVLHLRHVAALALDPRPLVRAPPEGLGLWMLGLVSAPVVAWRKSLNGKSSYFFFRSNTFTTGSSWCAGPPWSRLAGLGSTPGLQLYSTWHWAAMTFESGVEDPDGTEVAESPSAS
jgi:hypothetical protein